MLVVRMKALFKIFINLGIVSREVLGFFVLYLMGWLGVLGKGWFYFWFLSFVKIFRV